MKFDHLCEQLYPPLVFFFSDELGEFPARVPTGANITKESDEEILIPTKYWYAIGRDAALEKAIADSIRKRLR